MHRALLSLSAVALLLGAAQAGEPLASAPIAENAQADGTVTLKGGSVAAGIGYTWGHGELNYGNVLHPFSIKGVSIVDVGAAEYTATGHVYNLKRVGDFAGDYVAAAAGATVAGGASATYLKNEHGVVIKLVATSVGLKFTLAADGVHISLRK